MQACRRASINFYHRLVTASHYGTEYERFAHPIPKTRIFLGNSVFELGKAIQSVPVCQDLRLGRGGLLFPYSNSLDDKTEEFIFPVNLSIENKKFYDKYFSLLRALSALAVENRKMDYKSQNPKTERIEIAENYLRESFNILYDGNLPDLNYRELANKSIEVLEMYEARPKNPFYLSNLSHFSNSIETLYNTNVVPVSGRNGVFNMLDYETMNHVLSISCAIASQELFNPTTITNRELGDDAVWADERTFSELH